MGTYAVTGSGGGIGGAIRHRIEAGGHRVLGLDLAGEEIDVDLSTDAGRGAAIGSVAASVDALEGLVVCAGVPPTITPSSLIAQINYFGAVDLLDGLLPLLQRGEQAAAVAISSNSLGTVPPDDEPLIGPLLDDDVDAAVAAADGLHGATVYGMSKRALARAVRRRAPAWAEAGVRLNAVAPGAVETDLLQATLDDPELGAVTAEFPIPIGRRGRVDDIADATWFALAEAPFMVGSVLFVDGGSDALMRPDQV